MKALFFLRHYNDIDHITPIICKWVNSGHQCDVVLIGSTKFRSDFRIQFLGGLERVRVAHIRELLSPMTYIKWRVQMLLLTGNLRRLFIAPLISTAAKIHHAKKREPLWRYTADRLLKRTFNGLDKGIIAFDWIERNSVICVEWVEVVVRTAREMGLGAVSLPHGDSPHANQLIRRGERLVTPDTLFSAANIFDQLVVPNELCAKRFRPFLDDQAIAVLGSPRFCEEWLPKLAKILPSPLSMHSSSRLKIVLFLRKANFTTFWEEVGEVIQLIAAFQGVQLIIKPHTRSGWKQPLTRDRAMQSLPNVSVAFDDAHSVHLMNWADVIIDMATSVVFEAIRRKKPVLAADYLHAGRSTIAEYMPETELRCRDDVYKKISYFLSTGCDNFYVEANRQRFLKNILDVGGVNVLSHYVTLLEKTANKSCVPRVAVLSNA